MRSEWRTSCAYRKLQLLSLLSLAGACSSSPKVCEEMSYASDFRVIDSSLLLPLSIPVQIDGKRMIYDNPTVGAKIESVEADGRRLKGKELFAFWDDFDLGEREIHAPFHLYQLENAESDDSGNFQLLTVTWIQEDDFDVMEFLIPQNVQKLIIRYRPRFPLNHLAHEMTVTATRSESGP